MMPYKSEEDRRQHHREYMKQYLSDPKRRQKHLKRVRQNDSARRKAVRLIIDEWKSTGCKLCDEDALCCLSAHHRDGETKLFSVGNAVRTKMSPDRVKAELAKCVCLCENCHRKIHAGLKKLDAE